MPPPDPQRELAEELVEETLLEFDHVMTAEVRAAIRSALLHELLYTSEGQRRLRAARPDPIVQSSADIVKPGALPSRKRKGGA